MTDATDASEERTLTNYLLTDGERSELLLAALIASTCPAYKHPPADLINAIAKIEGTDTVLSASRAYPPKMVLADD
jgi:hypothetical protein